MGLLGGLFGASWGPLWGFLGASWSLLGASWSLLGASWGPLGASWGPLGAEGPKSPFGYPVWAPSWSRLGGLLGRLGSLLGRLGAVLGPCGAFTHRSGSRSGETEMRGRELRSSVSTTPRLSDDGGPHGMEPGERGRRTFLDHIGNSGIPGTSNTDNDPGEPWLGLASAIGSPSQRNGGRVEERVGQREEGEAQIQVERG